MSDPVDVDFSEFHPLDHGIWDPVCWGWAGGIGRHLSLWRMYQFEWPWQSHMAKRACDRGLHHVIAYWDYLPHHDGKEITDPATGLMCRDCDWVRWT